jgi:hypothetical protein
VPWAKAQPLRAMLRARMPNLTAKIALLSPAQVGDGGYDVYSISCYAILSASAVPA